MKDTLMKVLKATEIFEESLTAAMFNDNENAMQKLMEEFDVKGLKPEAFAKMLGDFSASLTNVPDEI